MLKTQEPNLITVLPEQSAEQLLRFDQSLHAARDIDIQVTDNCRLDKVSATFRPGMEDAEFLLAGSQIATMHKSNLLWMGDWILELYRRYNLTSMDRKEKAAILAKACELFGISENTANAVRWVASKIPPKYRSPDVTWSHLQLLASFGKEEGTDEDFSTLVELRDWVVRENATVEDLRGAAGRYKTKGKDKAEGKSIASGLRDITEQPKLNTESLQQTDTEESELDEASMGGYTSFGKSNIKLINTAIRDIHALVEWYETRLDEEPDEDECLILKSDLKPLLILLNKDLINVYEKLG